MICSMTAFARLSLQENWGQAVWELRSVNHRYLDISLKLPEPFRAFEGACKERIAKSLGRGKVDGILVFTPSGTSLPPFEVNINLVEQLSLACEKVTKAFPKNEGLAPMTMADLLRWPDVLQMPAPDMAPLEAPLLGLLDNTLKELVDCRAREGKGLAEGLQQKLSQMKTHLASLRALAPKILPMQREKLLTRLGDIKESCDQTRLEQELVFMVGRSDIEEELDRLATHFQELQNVFDTGGQIGRRCDFLMQEVNREANTIAAKAVLPDMTQSAVEMKVLVEQMREQIQNVE